MISIVLKKMLIALKGKILILLEDRIFSLLKGKILVVLNDKLLILLKGKILILLLVIQPARAARGPEGPAR